MSNIKKLMMTAASGASGLNIEEVFSAHVYKGAGSAQNVVNNIDLSNEGGLVWIKNRGSYYNHELYDTERGATKDLGSNQLDAEGTNSTGLTAFNSNGFTVSTSYPTGRNGQEYVSWAFRKEKKFFDVVTYTGNGTSGRTVAHNLGAVPGCIIIKRTDNSSNWIVYHRATAHGSTDPEDYALFLNTQDDVEVNTYWNNTAPTDSVFTLGNNTPVNANGGTYVAYLFAHNDGDGSFGPTGDQDIIKCGSYQGNGLDDGPEIDLGFEPQFVIIKASQRSANWFMYDNIRGLTAQGVNSTDLYANLDASEYNGAAYIAANSTGFKITDNSSQVNSGTTNFNKYVYIAIRRGPMAVPTNANTVFWTSSLDGTAPTYNSNNFPVDMAFHRHIGSGTAFHLVDRLRQRVNSNENYLITSNGDFETTSSAYLLGSMDYMNGWADDGNNTSYQSWMWRRAPSFFDVVPYNGNSTAGRTVSHNLGVTPEMIWVKSRDSSSYNWVVYHKDIVPSGTANQMYLHLNTNDIRDNNGNAWNDTDPTDTQFTLGNWALVNGTGDKYIAYLFATIPGVSKVGGYTGNGSELTVDCGFTNGAKFVLIKNTEQTGNGSWYIFDTKRGIVSGNDSFLELNTVNAENEYNDWIDPHSSGFTVGTNNASLCVNGRDFIFYAIAA